MTITEKLGSKISSLEESKDQGKLCVGELMSSLQDNIKGGLWDESSSLKHLALYNKSIWWMKETIQQEE